jgi:hypothetical protein
MKHGSKTLTASIITKALLIYFTYICMETVVIGKAFSNPRICPPSILSPR